MGSTHLSLILLTVGVFEVRDTKCDNVVCLDSNIEVAKLHLDRLVPTLRSNTSRGDAGVIGVIGGSIDSTGPPYLAAVGALRTGADVALIVTTEEAAPIIKTFVPDLFVYPYLNYKSSALLHMIILHMDVVVLGAGIGKSEDSMTLLHYIIGACKLLKKPLVIDGDGHYIITRYPNIIKGYPSPGCILTPNKISASRLQNALGNKKNWYNSWGDNVSVLIKDDDDRFYSPLKNFSWSNIDVVSRSRVVGEGDILVGCLATLYNWGLKKQPYCSNSNQIQLYQSIAAFSAVKLIKTSNYRGFLMFGRSMIGSDILTRIHGAFEDVFAKTADSGYDDYT